MEHHPKSSRPHAGNPWDERLLGKSPDDSRTVREACAAVLPEFRVCIRVGSVFPVHVREMGQQQVVELLKEALGKRMAWNDVRLIEQVHEAVLQHDLARAHVSHKAFERCKQHRCPLTFQDVEQYHQFMD